MSVWKKAAKANQKTHRERHQPEERKHLGLLEKKKDYVKRATDYNEKKATLSLLKKRALNKNPDEFYHHMVNSKVENGQHFEKETEEDDSTDQIKLMRSQDLKYITMKRTEEHKRIEKLQSQLHLSSVSGVIKNKHIYFDGKGKKDTQKYLENVYLGDINGDILLENSRKQKALYSELGKRIERERELSVIQQKIELKRHLETKTQLKPKRIKKGNKYRAAVYEWQYERKR